MRPGAVAFAIAAGLALGAVGIALDPWNEEAPTEAEGMRTATAHDPLNPPPALPRIEAPQLPPQPERRLPPKKPDTWKSPSGRFRMERLESPTIAIVDQNTGCTIIDNGADLLLLPNPECNERKPQP